MQALSTFELSSEVNQINGLVLHLAFNLNREHHQGSTKQILLTQHFDKVC